MASLRRKQPAEDCDAVVEREVEAGSLLTFSTGRSAVAIGPIATGLGWF